MLYIQIQIFSLLMHLSLDYIDLIQCASSTLLYQIKDLHPGIIYIINNFEKE